MLCSALTLRVPGGPANAKRNVWGGALFQRAIGAELYGRQEDHGVARTADPFQRQRDALAWRASVVTHGICIEIWSGRWDRTRDDDLRRLVDQLVEPITAEYLRSAG